MGRLLVLVLLVLSWACGSSSLEMKAAKTAMYNAQPEEILDLAIEVAKANAYDVVVDRTHLAFAAHYHHNMSGRTTRSSRLPEREESDTDVQGTLGWALEVVVVSVGDYIAVRVIPKSWEERLYAPPIQFAADDPNMPGFVIDRAAALSVAIYERAKSLIVAH